jgi:hypothetical protein
VGSKPPTLQNYVPLGTHPFLYHVARLATVTLRAVKAFAIASPPEIFGAQR